MYVSSYVKRLWRATRWKMIIIFGFFSVVSMALVACFSAALLNVVIRRENAYLIEERINSLVDNDKRFAPTLVDQIAACDIARREARILVEHPPESWPRALVTVTVMPKEADDPARPKWLHASSFTGVIRNHRTLEIRSFHPREEDRCSGSVVLSRPLTPDYLRELSVQAGLEISSSTPVRLEPNRAEEGLQGEIEANFVPGSGRAVPVVLVARNWQTGLLESWVVCQVRPSYSRTVDDLSHMGLATASWVTPFGCIALLLALVYGYGLYFSVRLSQHIVNTIDALTQAVLRVGEGDFSVRVVVPQEDQLGTLTWAFNEMTRELEALRQQEKQNAVLEREMVLAREVQEFLYPPSTMVLSVATASGIAKPARIVSGDLYDFFPFSDAELGLLCADISGKGISAALMMAHLQALAHGQLCPSDRIYPQPNPAAFVRALNGEFYGRFGKNRYATMFYGEFDGRSRVLRYVNAGHCRPILLSGERNLKKLSDGDLPVGLFPGITFQEFRISLSKGVAVIVYTDGLTDALNSEGEEFGEERLMCFCKSLPLGIEAESICQLLSNAVTEWSDGVEQLDDTTILVLTAN